MHSSTGELVFLQAQPLDPSVDLEHLREMDRRLLPNALVVGVVDIEDPQGIVVPVQDGGDDDHPVGVDFVVGQI